MPDASDDLKTLLGPDRRRIKPPGWQASTVWAIVLFVVVGIFALAPRQLPDVDLAALGFADNAIPATVENSTEGACSSSAELECIQVEFDLGDLEVA